MSQKKIKVEFGHDAFVRVLVALENYADTFDESGDAYKDYMAIHDAMMCADVITFKY